jgi:hypothetical protein
VHDVLRQHAEAVEVANELDVAQHAAARLELCLGRSALSAARRQRRRLGVLRLGRRRSFAVGLLL